MTLPSREDVPEDENWDLSMVFDSPEEWESTSQEFRDQLGKLKEYQGQSASDGETLRDLLDLVEDVKVRRLGSIWLYAFLHSYVDTTGDTARQRMSQYRDLKAEMDAVLGFLEPELQRAGQERIAEFIETTPGLASHGGPP